MISQMALADRILLELSAGEFLDDDELARRVGADRHYVNAVCRRLASKGLTRRVSLVGGKIGNMMNGQPVPIPNTQKVQRPEPAASILDGSSFERHARVVLAAHWGLELRPMKLALADGVFHSFDLVSPDASVVGDAKWYKDLKPSPSAKLSVIAEYVWLLGHVTEASKRFLVFGKDRSVPQRWLSRFSPLLKGVEFWFIEGDDLERLA